MKNLPKTNKGRQGMASELQKRATMFELRNDCAFFSFGILWHFLPLYITTLL